MQKFILITGFLLAGISAYSQSQPGTVSMDSLFRLKALESVGKPFPRFTADFNGQLLTSDSLKGKIVFINFWFEACPPCIAELPALNDLYRRYRDDKDFEFISFTHESPAKILLLRKKYHLEYKIASVSNQECYRLNQNNGFPTSIILNKDGTIIELFTGGDTDPKIARELITGTVFKKIDAALKP